MWQAPDQHERLSELLGESPDLKEQALRRDVRSLGRLLGQVIQQQEGDGLFETVEALRKLSIAGRNDEANIDSRVQIARNLDLANAGKLAKAFAMFFELTNLAETNHRKRR